MVANGHAIDWPKYSSGKYAGLQAKAKARHLGIWQGCSNCRAPSAIGAGNASRPATSSGRVFT
jgi:endonuclease YncB( thermonuclease family)